MMTQQKSRSRGGSKPIIPIHSGVVSGTIKVRIISIIIRLMARLRFLKSFSVILLRWDKLKRYHLFKEWYRHLRQEGVRKYGENQDYLPLYARYNVMNCAIWAFYNSGTHYIDGSYKR